jgi:hypothetical protein
MFIGSPPPQSLSRPSSLRSKIVRGALGASRGCAVKML